MEADEQRELADLAKAGDPLAWERLYRNVYPRLFGFAVARAGVDASEDLVNETMARAVAGISKFTWNGGGFDAWLFGILRRVCLEHHRRKKSAGKNRTVGLSVNYAEPGEALEQDEEAAAMRRAFATLNGADREILELRVIGGLSADEVARLVGKSPGAVRTAQSRALAGLRAAVGRQL